MCIITTNNVVNKSLGGGGTTSNQSFVTEGFSLSSFNFSCISFFSRLFIKFYLPVCTMLRLLSNIGRNNLIPDLALAAPAVCHDNQPDNFPNLIIM